MPLYRIADEDSETHHISASDPEHAKAIVAEQIFGVTVEDWLKEFDADDPPQVELATRDMYPRGLKFKDHRGTFLEIVIPAHLFDKIPHGLVCSTCY